MATNSATVQTTTWRACTPPEATSASVSAKDINGPLQRISSAGGPFCPLISGGGGGDEGWRWRWRRGLPKMAQLHAAWECWPKRCVEVPITSNRSARRPPCAMPTRLSNTPHQPSTHHGACPVNTSHNPCKATLNAEELDEGVGASRVHGHHSPRPLVPQGQPPVASWQPPHFLRTPLERLILVSIIAACM